MLKSNPLYVANYPEWKKTLWAVGRVFVDSFLVTFAFMLTSITVENFQSKETLVKLLVSIALGCLAAGLISVGKWLREQFPESAILAKMPF